MSSKKELKKVVKGISPIIPLLIIFLFIGINNLYKLSTSKIKNVIVSKYCMGINIDDIENNGSNYFCYELKKHGEATINNINKSYCTWYMNK